MRNISLAIGMALFLVGPAVPVSVAQQQDVPQTLEASAEIQGVDLNQSLSGVLVQDLARYSSIPLFLANANMLASSDGEYFAQDATELQTYYDLGMTYRYINEDFFRQQLQLPNEQGIAIATVSDKGLGQENGFQAGDIVLTVGDTPVDTQYDFVIALAAARGDQQQVVLRRAGGVQDLTVNLPEASVESDTRYIIGVNVESATDTIKAQLQSGGLVITSLTEDYPAVNAGLREHDIITHVNDRAVDEVETLRAVLKESGGEAVTIQYLRAARSHSVTLTPKEIADETSLMVVQNTPLLSFYVDPHLNRVASNEIMVLPQLSAEALLTEVTELSTSEHESTDQKLDRLLEQLESIRAEIEAIKSGR